MARSRVPAPSLALTRSAAPAVNLVLGYAAPELAAWVSEHREAVLRAAEAVETAYMAAVDELAPRLPGGVGAWERARGSVLFYDSEREEHLARPPTTVENVEGWQSRGLDPNGYRSVVALLPVRALNVENRWVRGFGSANGSAWTMTRLAPSPETPLELAGYDIRQMGVDVTQRAGEDGGGGSTMPTNKKPLDPIHELVLEAFRLERRKPLAEGQKRTIQKFNKTDVRWFLQPFFSPEAIKAVGEPTMMRRAAKALLDSGDLVPAGFLNHVAFAPAEPLSRLQYGIQQRAIRARSDEAARLTREQTVVPQPTTSGGKVSTQPVLDPMHELVLEAYLLEAVRPPRIASASEERRTGFSPGWVSSVLRDCGFSRRAQDAVVSPTYPGMSSPPSFVRASQIQHVRDALVNAGAVVPVERSGSGAVLGWMFKPSTPLSSETYEEAKAALAARAAALVADGTPLGDKLALNERMRAKGRRGL